MFSPPSIPEKPSWEAKVFSLTAGKVPPWDPRHPLSQVRLAPGKVWQHTVYGGVFELERLRDAVVGLFGENEEYRDERLSGCSALFAVSLNSSGKFIEDSAVVSACAWALGRTLRIGPNRRDWLDGLAWAAVRNDFVSRAAELGEPEIPLSVDSTGGALEDRVRSAAAEAAGVGITSLVTPTASAVAGPVIGAAVGKAAGTFAKQLVDPDKDPADAEEETDSPDQQEVDAHRRPVTVKELYDLLDEQVDLLGVRDALTPVEIWVKSAQVSVKAEDNSDNNFLNSFILEDLQRAHDELARDAGGGALTAFMRPRHTIDTSARVDLRQSVDVLLAETAPSKVPSGRWVTMAEHALALSQQFAVNQIVDGRTGSHVPVFAVNGPPGTGKTTMLRDVIAALVVERASVLAALASPRDAFTGPELPWSTEAWRQKVQPLRPELTGFEMVVACAGNNAAKNITHQFPGPDGIDAEWRESAREVDYFAATASIALEIDEAKPDKRAWGAVAGALGNMELRRTFNQRFWWGVTAREEAAARREERMPDGSGHGLADILSQQRKNGQPVDWKAAVARFAAARATVDRLVAERQAAFEASGTRLTERARSAELTAQRSAMEEEKRHGEAELATLTAQLSAAASAARQAAADRAEHKNYRPGLWISLSTRGKAGRDWYERDKQLAAVAEERMAALASIEQAAGVTAGRLRQISAVCSRLDADIAATRTRIARADATWSSVVAKWPKNVPSDELLDDENRRELLSPWNDPEIAAARTRLFLEALRLHKQFLLAEATTMRRNLQAAFDLISGNAPADIAAATAKAAWQSLFLVVPVVSTTFASMGRLFSHLGSEDLGWVLIDEAGQAAPQNAVGALWRAQRAVIVGDPLQLEPVVTVPHTLQQALREHYRVDEEWLPGWTSVQGVADRLAPHGTYLEIPSRDGTRERTWVGTPLRVHRRCDDPMFSISNQIAYGGLMVNGKYGIPADKDPYLALQTSRWVDVQGAEVEGTWIPEEGEKLRQIIMYLLRERLAEPSKIRVISPFRNVVEGVKELGLGLPGRDAVGTIHTMQGKEADIVFLVLGGGKKGQRGWAAEKPNLLNVAVSRAKRRLYVIGNREQWSTERYFSQLAAQLPESPKPAQ